MKNRLIILLNLLSFCLFTYSQDVNPKLRFGLVVNTDDGAFIQISISPENLGSDIVDLNEIGGFRLMVGGKDLIENLDPSNKKIRKSRQSIKLNLENLTSENLIVLLRGVADAQIVFDSNLEIMLENGNDLVYSKEDVAAQSNGRLVFEESQKEAYIKASGGEYAFMMNRFEMDYVPKGESDSGEGAFAFDFAYRKAYSLKFLDGKAYLNTEGFVSTNKNDSLNYLKIYPISYKLTDTQSLSETVVEAGIEGTQQFDYWRYSLNLEYRFLFENLINLSQGYNRLRLKPVVSAGLKLYSEQDNSRIGENAKNEDSGQLYTSMYYVIPAFDSFTIIVDGEGFYDVNESVNPNKRVQFNYQISFGYELKNQGFQTLVTYRNGKTNINYENDSLISIGVLAQLSR